MKKSLALTLSFAVIVSLFSFGGLTAEAYDYDAIQSVYVGDTYSFYADIQYGRVITSTTWSSSDTSIASIVSNDTHNCTVKANAVSSSGVRITCKYRYHQSIGYGSGSSGTEYHYFLLKVRERPVTSISLDKDSISLNKGKQAYLTATVRPSTASQSVWWSSSNTAVATVSGGVVTATGLGTATISATAGSYTATCQVEVVNPVITYGAIEFTFDGSQKLPQVEKITDAVGNTVSKSEYSVVCDDDGESVGLHTATIVFGGSFRQCDSVTIEYTILPRNTVLQQVSATVNGFQAVWEQQSEQISGYQLQYSLTNDFSAEYKTVVVSDKRSTSTCVQDLIQNKEYFVHVRTYQLINGQTYYSAWSDSVSVTPVAPQETKPATPEKPSVKTPKGTIIIKLTALKKAFYVQWKKQQKDTTGYQVQYATNKQFTKGKKTITVKGTAKTKLTIKKLKAKQTYYVRVRTYKTVNKKNYFSTWSGKRIVITKK